METVGLWWMWTGFAVFVLVAVVLDLFVLESRGAKKVEFRSALNWTIVWVTLSFVFNGLLWYMVDANHGPAVANEKAMEFLAGYLIEKSLAVDNIFVFLMLFRFFAVPMEYQRRVLILGVLGAIVLRAVMILAGAWLLEHFHWLLYFFGALLLYTGFRMFTSSEEEHDIEANPILRWMRAHIPITREYHAERFSLVLDGKRWYTPLFVVMVMIGITDVIFAVDSIPAIFAITLDPFIVLTSNVFAILGLRAMYFMLADLADRFHLLKYGLAIVLMFIGVKMLLLDVYKIPIFIALGVVALVLTVSIISSLYATRPAVRQRIDTGRA